MSRKMRRPTVSQIIGLIVASLIVGFFLKALDITPTDFWRGLWERLSAMALFAWESVDSLLIYILMGAAIVVPLYIILLIVRKKRL